MTRTIDLRVTIADSTPLADIIHHVVRDVPAVTGCVELNTDVSPPIEHEDTRQEIG